MRLLRGVVGAAALAGALGACAAIAGLSPYSSEECPAEGCDASVHPNPHDGGGGTGVDVYAAGDDADAGSADDGGPEGGCAEELLACDGGCLKPSSSSSCGGCDNACGGDAALCAPGGDASFACVSSCPASAPTDCNNTCSNTSSDPDNCSACGNACTTSVANADPECVDGGCAFACDANYTLCGGACVDFMTDRNNCGGCGASFACAAGLICSGGGCTSEVGPGDAGDSGVACPDGGCPSSTATGFSCPPSSGTCNGASNQCATSGGCFCSNDTQCKSSKCVKVVRENDVSCGSNCTGSGSRDGYNCALASPGIPSLGTGGTYSCPANSGYKNTPLSCDPTHTNCYCTADNQCTTGKCIPSANNGNCAGCTGTGTADYRGCQPTVVIGGCPIYIGCPPSTQCQYPICYCNADVACESGHCIPSNHNGNCAGCTGTGADDGHGCMPAPSSVACVGTGGTSCTTTLTPAPVINAGKTACLCVADSDCSSGKCVDHDNQCTGTCTGSGSADSEDCQTATSVANTWSCSIGNCDSVSSPTGQCTAAGVPCWCTSDSECPSGTQCATWSGCASGSCTGSGAGNAFHCVP